MRRISGIRRNYAWGSKTAIPQLLGFEADSEPFAELWFGDHPSGPSSIQPGGDLRELIGSQPAEMLGQDVIARFGDGLPYLLKVLAATKPLSLQVHPHIEQARRGFEAEESSGIAVDARNRNYRDANHKPELVYALTKFEALCGFRAPRRAAELLNGLDTPLARELGQILKAKPDADGVREAFTRIIHPDTRATAEEVTAIVNACAEREANGSPSPRTDRIVQQLAEHYPGDPGVVTSLLLNPVTLHPGDAMFVPAGCVHAYLEGTAIEVMAASDNVLRAGLTPKHVDVEELLSLVDCVAAPPLRIAPEVFYGATRVYYAPVDDFELSVTDLSQKEEKHPLPGRGPRVVLCLDGNVELFTAREALRLSRGEAAFVSSSDGPLAVHGQGTIVQADVP